MHVFKKPLTYEGTLSDHELGQKPDSFLQMRARHLCAREGCGKDTKMLNWTRCSGTQNAHKMYTSSAAGPWAPCMRMHAGLWVYRDKHSMPSRTHQCHDNTQMAVSHSCLEVRSWATLTCRDFLRPPIEVLSLRGRLPSVAC